MVTTIHFVSSFGNLRCVSEVTFCCRLYGSGELNWLAERCQKRKLAIGQAPQPLQVQQFHSCQPSLNSTYFTVTDWSSWVKATTVTDCQNRYHLVSRLFSVLSTCRSRLFQLSVVSWWEKCNWFCSVVAVADISLNHSWQYAIYRVIKKSLCTWLLQYKKRKIYFKQFQ
jgi:hypothetical protein